MATVAELTEQIALKQGQKKTLLEQAGQLDQSASSWIADANGTKIRGGNKKTGDEAEKLRKLTTGSNYKQQAVDKRQEALRIDSDITALNEQILAMADAERELARQGTTSKAVEAVALGTAEATIRGAVITAEATANAIDAETENNKIYLYVGIGVGVVIVLVVFFTVILPKLKKKKPAKK